MTSQARTLAVIALMGAVIAVLVLVAWPRRMTPRFEPPVLAGQPLWGSCSGGVYARRGTTIVLTSSGHCATPGTVAYEPDGSTVRGTFGQIARDPVCPYPGHICAASDINEFVVAANRIPWGHLHMVDMGGGGHREIAQGTRPLRCSDIALADPVEINGRGIFRTGTVLEKGENLKPADADGAYFPCMVAADIQVATGDSGGVVLVRGIPGGVTSRSFDGYLGFTPLAEGLTQLGLELCTTPNCGINPP